MTLYNAGLNKYRFRLPNTLLGKEYRIEWFIELAKANGELYVQRWEKTVIGTGAEMFFLPDQPVVHVPPDLGDKVTIERVGIVNDDSCSTCSAPGVFRMGEGTPGGRISLGRAGWGESAGDVVLERMPTESPLLGQTKGWFSLSRPRSDVNLFDKWITTPQQAANLDTNGTNIDLKLHMYPWSSVVATNGTWMATNSPQLTWKVESGESTLQFTRTEGASVAEQYTFAFFNDDWTETSDKGVTYANAWAVATNGAASFTRVQGGTGVPAASKSQSFGLNAWGERVLTKELKTVGSAIRTNTISYYEGRPSWADYGNVTRPIEHVTYYDGSWENFGYDYGSAEPAAGLVTTIYKSFKDGDYYENTDPAELTSLWYATNDPTVDDLSILPASPRYTQTVLLPGSFIIKQQLHVYAPGYVKTHLATVANPDFDITDPNVLITTTHWTTDSLGVRISAIENPDGTRSSWSYTDAVTNLIITNLVGNTNFSQGLRRVTRLNSSRMPIQETLADIASGITLQNDVLDLPDIYGRPQRITHLDGSIETVVFSCCGIDAATDRDGTTTQYSFDKRRNQTSQTRAGITQTNLLDALGRVYATYRIGTNGSSILTRGVLYDGFNEIVAETNSLGGITTYDNSFSSGRRVFTTTYPDGGTRIETFYKDGRLWRVTGSAVNPVEYDYAPRFDYEVGDSFLATRETKLDDAFELTSEWVERWVDIAGREARIVWSAPLYVANPVLKKFYNSKGQLATVIDPDGVTTLYQYDSLGEVEFVALDVTVEGEKNGLIDFDGSDRIMQIVRNVTTNTTLQANVVRERRFVWDTIGSNSSNLLSTVETSVNGLTNWTTLWDGATAVTTRTVTQHLGSGNRRVTQTAPDGSSAVTDFSNGRAQSITWKNSSGSQIAKTSYKHDAHGRLQYETDARNGATTYSYNDADEVATLTAPLAGDGSPAQTTTQYYTSMGRNWKTSFADGTSVTNEFTLRGELRKRSGSRSFPVEYFRDSSSRVTAIKTWRNFAGNANPATNSFAYNPYSGLLDTSEHGASAGPAYTWTAGGRLSSRAWARGINTTYTYGDGGENATTSYDDGFTASLTYSFDRRGRLASVDHAGMLNSFGYNLAGNVLSLGWTGGALDGLAVTNSYDAYQRLSTTRLANQPSSINSFTYDTAGRLATAGDGTNAVTYGYLANSWLAGTLTFKNVTTTRLTATRTYDYLNRLSAVSAVTGSGGFNDFHGYGFNAANQRERATEADGSYWSNQYDSLGQLTSAKKRWADGVFIPGEQFEYAYDSIGNRTSTKEGGDATGGSLRTATYTPSSLNQYTNRTVPATVEMIGVAKPAASLTVDGSSSVYRRGGFYEKAVTVNNTTAAQFPALTVTATISTNSESVTARAFVAKSPENFSYDEDGNLTQDGRWSYTWNAENRLTQLLSLTNTPTQSKFRLNFEYDPWGRRIQQAIAQYTNSTWTTVLSNRFVYDGWNLIAELNATNNNLIRSYVWGADLSGNRRDAGGIGGLVLFKEGGANAQFLAYDGNGNVTSLTSASTGQPTAIYEYGPFLEPIRATGPMADRNPFQGSTKYRDLHSGFLYYGHRYYDPDPGRWLNRDPLSFDGGLNLYAFARNDPINWIDADGREPVTATAAGVIITSSGNIVVTGATVATTVTSSSGGAGLTVAISGVGTGASIGIATGLGIGTVAIGGGVGVGYAVGKIPIGGGRNVHDKIAELMAGPDPGGAPLPLPQRGVYLGDGQNIDQIGNILDKFGRILKDAAGNTRIQCDASDRLDRIKGIDEDDWLYPGKKVSREASDAVGVAKGGTYLLRDAASGNVMRTGRTSDLARRAAEHRNDPLLRDYEFEPVHRTDDYNEQRGLEQLLHDAHRPPLNKIRPISPTNFNLPTYENAARTYLKSR